MKPDRAIAELEALKSQAQLPEVRRSGPEHARWKASVLAVLGHAMPVTSTTPTKFEQLRYSVGVWSGAPGEPERDRRYFASQVDRAVGLIDAAIYELTLMNESSRTPDGAFDDELWSYVRHNVEEERWAQVASAAATFLEDKVRRWSGTPQDDSGKVLVGQALFAKALGEGGALALGSQANEATGWRSLGTGFTAALGNVDRHNIQDRPDLKQYAMGVVGLASLILTQIRHEHPDVVAASVKR